MLPSRNNNNNKNNNFTSLFGSSNNGARGNQSQTSSSSRPRPKRNHLSGYQQSTERNNFGNSKEEKINYQKQNNWKSKFPNKVKNLVELMDVVNSNQQVVEGVVTEIFSERNAYYLSDNTNTIRLEMSGELDTPRLVLGSTIRVIVTRIGIHSNWFSGNYSTVEILEDKFEKLVEGAGILIYIQESKEFVLYKLAPPEFGSIDYSLNYLRKNQKGFTRKFVDFNVLESLLLKLSDNRIKELENKIFKTELDMDQNELIAFFESVREKKKNQECENFSYRYGIIRGKYSTKDGHAIFTGTRELLEELKPMNEIIHNHHTLFLPGSVEIERLNYISQSNSDREEIIVQSIEPLPMITLTKVVVLRNLLEAEKPTIEKGLEKRYKMDVVFVKLDQIHDVFGEKNSEKLLKLLKEELNEQ